MKKTVLILGLVVIVLAISTSWMFVENRVLSSDLHKAQISMDDFSSTMNGIQELMDSKDKEILDLKDQVSSINRNKDEYSNLEAENVEVRNENDNLKAQVEDLNRLVDIASMTLEVEREKLYNRWGVSMDAHMNIVSSEDWGDLSVNEVYRLLGLRTEDAIDLLGNDYEVVHEGIEGSFRGYQYSEHGIILASQDYYEEDEIVKVFLGEGTEINGTNLSMNLEEVMDVLGENEVVEIQTEGDEYWLFYEYDHYTVEYRVTNRIDNELEDISITLPGQDDGSWRFP